MITVRQLLAEKGSTVWSIKPASTVLEALHLLEKKDIGALLVLDDRRLVGIFSERDFARKVSQSDQLDLTMPVSEIMVTTVYYVTIDQSLEECMELMTARHIRHLPVLDGDRLRGIISIGDVVKEIISDRDSTIRGLENYIIGREYSH